MQVGVRRMSRAAVQLVAAVAVITGLLVVAAPPSESYCTIGWTRWSSGNTPPVAVWSSVPGSWDSSINNSRVEWDNQTVNAWWPHTSTLNIPYPEFNPYGPYQWNMYYGNFVSWGIPNSWPGATYNGSGSTHSTSSMYFNSNWSWNFNGTLNEASMQADVHTVVMHEMGHANGLGHPWDCGSMTTAEQQSAMNADFTRKWDINSDDAAGIHARY